MERLFLSLKLMEIRVPAAFTKEHLSERILSLCVHNGCIQSARVRLAVYRNEANEAEYVIEAIPFSTEPLRWNEEGYVIGLYPYARKNADAFANLKTANFLPYVLAARYAMEKGLDDTLVLNAAGNICDSSRANIFLVKRGEVHTPALHQGCINGVMRRFVDEGLKRQRIVLHQDEISETDLLDADEVFLTNALIGIKWVRQFKEKTYHHSLTYDLFQALFSEYF